MNQDNGHPPSYQTGGGCGQGPWRGPGGGRRGRGQGQGPNWGRQGGGFAQQGRGQGNVNQQQVKFDRQPSSWPQSLMFDVKSTTEAALQGNKPNAMNNTTTGKSQAKEPANQNGANNMGQQGRPTPRQSMARGREFPQRHGQLPGATSAIATQSCHGQRDHARGLQQGISTLSELPNGGTAQRNDAWNGQAERPSPQFQ